MIVDGLLKAGRNYTLYLRYATRIHHALDGGVFLASYSVGNETRYHAVTQMQAQEARRVFPCFDEPSFKAVFQINVIHPTGTTAISNTDVYSKTALKNSWTKTTFEVTPIMSTYLLALAITDFGYIEDRYRNVTLRVWAMPDALPYCSYALKLMSKALQFYEKYFDIPYPLSKLDLYAIRELRVNAMENWGMITARHRYVLYDQTFSSTTDKAQVDMTLFHEIAHMWFGNLITMTLPSFGRDDTRQLRILNPTIRTDNEVLEGFNIGTYYKGEALVRMVKRVTGEKFFQRTMQHFIKSHMYDNVVSENLTNALTRALEKYDHNNPFDGMAVTDVMQPWTHQKGFPTIMVKTINETTMAIRQASFDGMTKKFIENETWIVPVFYREDFRSSEQKLVWLKDNKTVLLNNVAIINPNFWGYYNVFYDNYDKLKEVLFKDHELLNETARKMLLLQMFRFQRNELLTTEPLELSLYARKESDEGPINVLCNFFQLYDIAIPNNPNLRKYIFHILVPVFERVKIDRSQRDHEQIRKILLLRLCSWEYKNCLDYVLSAFSLLKDECQNELLSSTCNKIAPGIRQAVYSMAVKYGPPDNFDFLFKKYKIEKRLTEQEKIFPGLIGTRDCEQFMRIMELVDSDTTDLSSSMFLWSYQAGNHDNHRPCLYAKAEQLLKPWIEAFLHNMKDKKLKSLIFGMINTMYRIPTTEENLKLLDKYDILMKKILPPPFFGITRESRNVAKKDLHSIFGKKELFEKYFENFVKRLENGQIN
uniref:Aminopeptidase n=1 Tax=Panagrolaimus sp. JU765 TaxID=591449 RepID=A0AC34RS54_9BILA